MAEINTCFQDVETLISVFNLRGSRSFPDPVIVVIFWIGCIRLNERKVNLLFSLLCDRPFQVKFPH